MSGIFYIFILFIIGSLIMSMFRNQGRNYPGRNARPNDQSMHMNNTMHPGAGDMNFNGVPDYMEQDQIDRDHDGVPDYLEPHNVDTDHNGIPDYMDPNPGSFNGSSNDSTDTGSFDTGSFDSGSIDAGGSDFSSGSFD